MAFLAHNHNFNTNRDIGAEDVFIVVRGWTGSGVGATGGAIAVLVRYPECTKGVVKATFAANTSVIEALCAKVDEMLADTF